MSIELVVFDAAGTIIEVKNGVPQVYQSVAARHNVELDLFALQTAFKRFFASTFEQLSSSLVSAINGLSGSPANILQRFNHALQHQSDDLMTQSLIDSLREVRLGTSELDQKRLWKQLVSQCITASAVAPVREIQITAIFDSLWEHFAQPQAWTVAAGFVETAEYLKAREIPWVIGSNFDLRLQRVLDGHHCFATCQRVFHSAQVGFEKPDQRFYAAVSEEFNVDAGSILMIGDCLIRDAIAPRLHGWNSRLLDKRATVEQHEHCLQSLAQLPLLIRSH